MQRINTKLGPKFLRFFIGWGLLLTLCAVSFPAVSTTTAYVEPVLLWRGQNTSATVVRYFSDPDSAFAFTKSYYDIETKTIQLINPRADRGSWDEKGMGGWAFNQRAYPLAYDCHYLPPNYPDSVSKGCGSITVSFRCPQDSAGFGIYDSTINRAWGLCPITLPSTTDSTPPGQCPRHGNPVLPLAGLKLQEEQDAPALAGGLSITRRYRSDQQQTQWDRANAVAIAPLGNPFANPNFGTASDWCIPLNYEANAGEVQTHCFRVLAFKPSTSGGGTPNNSVLLKLAGAGFREVIFSSTSKAVDRDRELVQRFTSSGVADGYVVVTEHNIRETYSASGALEKLSYPNGQTTTLAYTPGSSANPSRVASATDSFGRSYDFQYNAHGRISAITDSAGNVISYHYDEAPFACVLGDCGALTSVTFADGTRRQYIYNESAQAPAASANQILMTGLVDELGNRNGSYFYDTTNRAVATEKARGIERWSVDLSAANQRTITPPVGGHWVMRFATVAGYAMPTGTDQPAGSGCGPASSAITYDAAANVTSRTDFNNHKTCYAYDLTRNLETKRVEGLDAATACTTALTSPPSGDTVRTTTTQWHPDWRLETKRAEPKRITTWTYNGLGATCAPADALVDGKPIAVVCSKSEQATTDETGALGFAATPIGTARTYAYTYNRWGQVLVSTSPTGEVTANEYYPDTQPNWTLGDLKQTTNALGHITRFTKYNRHGQVTERIDPNGLVTQYTYDLRQRLTRISAGDEQTTYAYDPVGNLIQTTLPDGSFITYTYDAAHRLTRVQDNKGNTIDYTLDAMGNRIAEQTRDASGALVRNVTRTMDALNRVQSVVGE